VGLQFGWLTAPLVPNFVMATAVPTLGALAVRGAPAVLGGADAVDTSTASAAAPAAAVPTGVWPALARRPTARATAIVVSAVAAIALLIDLAPVPTWVVIGITLSIALDPLVGWVDRHTPLRRTGAIATVIVGLLAAVAATFVFAVPSVADSVRDLDDQLP
jgi:hypothetical protein